MEKKSIHKLEPGDEFCSSVFLGDDCNKLKQIVYASQLYGTFFGVYAQIKSSRIRESRQINEMKLSIINYKGLINIGLIEAEFNHDENKIDLIVQGLMNPKITLNVNFGQTNPTFDPGDIITLERNLYRLSNTPKEPNKSYVFDSEYYGRDGDLRYPLIRYEQMKEKDIKINLQNKVNKDYFVKQGNDITDELDSKNLTKMAPSPRCVPANLHLTF